MEVQRVRCRAKDGSIGDSSIGLIARQHGDEADAHGLTMLDAEVVIVGAGPHGLSAAVHLQRQGIDVQVFGSPMSFWRGMPGGMQLRSNISATSMIEPTGPLSLGAYMSSMGVRLSYPVPLEEFINYGSWVRGTALPDVDQRSVADIQARKPGFVLDLADGDRLSARKVVIAAGIAPFAYMPAHLRHLPRGRVSHTGSHADTAVFAGQRVAVIGGGQSALESAALIQEHGGTVEVIVRSRRVIWLHRRSRKRMMGPLGRVLYAPTDVGPLWYSRLVAAPDVFRRLPRNIQTRVAYRSIRPACSHFVRVRLDPVRLTLGAGVVRAETTGPHLRLMLSDASEREVDHLLLGTGYRVDVARYPFLGPRLLASLGRLGGYPVLRRGLETSVPGLYMTGAPAALSFGPVMRFVSGSWYAGRAIAESIRAASSPRHAAIAVAAACG